MLTNSGNRDGRSEAQPENSAPIDNGTRLMKRGAIILCKRTAQLFLILALSLLLVEVMVVIFLPKPISGWMSMTLNDPLLQHRMSPNGEGTFHEDYTYTMRLNELGFRDVPLKKKGPKTIRLLVIGDSFTQGIGVSDGETYSDFLEQRLNNTHPEIDWDVINAGVHGYGIVRYALLARRFVNELAPDAMLIMGCSNDLVEAYRYFYRPVRHVGDPWNVVLPFKRYSWDVEYWNKQEGEWSDSYSNLGKFPAGPPAFWYIPKGFPKDLLPTAEKQNLDLVNVLRADNTAPLGEISQSNPVFKWPPTSGANKYRITFWPTHDDPLNRWSFIVDNKSEGEGQVKSPYLEWLHGFFYRNSHAYRWCLMIVRIREDEGEMPKKDVAFATRISDHLYSTIEDVAATNRVPVIYSNTDLNNEENPAYSIQLDHARSRGNIYFIPLDKVWQKLAQRGIPQFNSHSDGHWTIATNKRVSEQLYRGMVQHKIIAHLRSSRASAPKAAPATD